jgi:hypothetical protein
MLREVLPENPLLLLGESDRVLRLWHSWALSVRRARRPVTDCAADTRYTIGAAADARVREPAEVSTYHTQYTEYTHRSQSFNAQDAHNPL